MLGIGCDLLQRLGGGAEQEAVDHPGVLQGDRAERRWECKHYMKVFDREQLGLTVRHPLRRGAGLTLGAMPVAARIVGDLPVATPVALLDVATQRRGPAGGDVAQGTALLRRERAAVPLEEGIAVLSEDLGYFEPGPGHD